ncbi:MAG TPA: outer membrane beta-barrel protein [Edaphobacter sp.]|nr:outer membrane beta-barrel protein [Edaphobacter sp.]
MRPLKTSIFPASRHLHRARAFFVSIAAALFCATVLSGFLHAQAKPTASRFARLQIGGGSTTALSDYHSRRFNGLTAYLDLDFTPHLGFEGAFHLVKDGAGTGIYEKTYEIGGRYSLNRRRLSPYVRAMYGRGVFNFEDYPGYGHPNLAYNLLAIGGGLDYRILPHINARADAEYQRWFGFPPHGLTPTLLTIGAAYRF